MQNNSTESKICIISPNKQAYSETFIHSHINKLPNTLPLYGGFFPIYDLRDREIIDPYVPIKLSKHFFRAIKHKFNASELENYRDEALARFLLKNNVRTVLAEYGPTGAEVIRACNIAGLPLNVHFHGVDAYSTDVLSNYKNKYPALFEAAKAIIVVSQHMKNRLEWLGAPAKKIFIKPFGVDIEMFSNGKPGNNPSNFLFVGRYVDKKAPYINILAFRELVNIVPEASFNYGGRRLSSGHLQISSRNT